MRIGIPKEIKESENRVAIIPATVEGLVKSGHEVIVEKGAGEGSGYLDEDYEKYGAKMLTADDAWACDMVIKVKEPQESEYKYFRKGLILFTYLHLASSRELTEALIKNEVTAIAYETVQKEDNSLPLLAPMSEIAGRMAFQKGAHFLEKINGGSGKLIDGVPGVAPCHVVVIGAGVVGAAAVKRAVGIGCRVTCLDVNIDRLKYLQEVYNFQLETRFSNHYNLEKVARTADVIISSVLIPGDKAPKIVTEDIVKIMKKGSVIVDVAIDQGGSVETIKGATTHTNPVFEKYGVIHYAVGNMPGVVPKTSTNALVNATTPYISKLATYGIDAIKNDNSLKKGLNVFNGKLTYEPVAKVFDMEYVNADELL